MIKTLKYVADYSKKRISLDEICIDNYVATDNLLQNKQGKTIAEKMPKQTFIDDVFPTGELCRARPNEKDFKRRLC